jgi:chromosomal replication initiation ATPase DnaA
MTTATSQLTFDLAHLSASGAEDFMVSAANQSASDLVQHWPNWPAPSVLIQGEAGVGKSHLVHIWSERAVALRILGRDITENRMGQLLVAAAIAIEDLDRGIGDERALFHLLNHARDGKTCLLMTSRTEPGELEIALPDLRSRLRALPVVRIERPDDTLLHVLLVKLFTDRQLLVSPTVIRYLSTHMERSAEAAVQVVAEIDRIALATHRKPSAALAGEALRNITTSKP